MRKGWGVQAAPGDPWLCPSGMAGSQGARSQAAWLRVPESQGGESQPTQPIRGSWQDGTCPAEEQAWLCLASQAPATAAQLVPMSPSHSGAAGGCEGPRVGPSVGRARGLSSRQGTRLQVGIALPAARQPGDNYHVLFLKHNLPLPPSHPFPPPLPGAETQNPKKRCQW